LNYNYYSYVYGHEHSSGECRPHHEFRRSRRRRGNDFGELAGADEAFAIPVDASVCGDRDDRLPVVAGAGVVPALGERHVQPPLELVVDGREDDEQDQAHIHEGRHVDVASHGGWTPDAPGFLSLSRARRASGTGCVTADPLRGRGTGSCPSGSRRWRTR